MGISNLPPLGGILSFMSNNKTAMNMFVTFKI